MNSLRVSGNASKRFVLSLPSLAPPLCLSSTPLPYRPPPKRLAGNTSLASLSAYVTKHRTKRNPRSRYLHQTVITLIKTSLSLSDPIHVTTALFYREDGSIDPTPVFVDEDSWKELAPYVHTLHVEDDLDRPSTALSTHSTLSGTVGVIGVTNGSATSPSPSKGSSGLNSNASTFVPSSNASISIKTGDGKVGLQGLRKPSFSPSCKFSSKSVTRHPC